MQHTRSYVENIKIDQAMTTKVIYTRRETWDAISL